MGLLQRDHGRAALRSERSERLDPIERLDRPGNRWTLASVPGAPATEVGVVDRVFVVRPAGALPDRLPERLVERLAGLVADQPVIIDLSGSSVDSAAPVVGLAGSVLGADQPGRCCVVCAAPTRDLLRDEDVTGRLALFGSIGDALQARRFARDGYGRGWSPDPPLSARARRSREAVARARAS